MMREGQAARAPIRRLRTAVVLLLTTIVVGVVGYLVLGAPTVADAVYMVAITLFTVGFGEVFPLTETGRWFTVGLIVVGFGSATFSAVSAMEVIADGHVKALLRRNQMDRRIAQLRGHVIVCGYGRVGRHLVGELAAAGHGFVVVEAGEARVSELREAEHLYVDADATEELTLHEAGIERADALVACVADDGDNVLIVLTAKGLNPDVQTVARVKADENEPKLRRAGADHVLVPTAIGGRRIAEMLTRPAVGAYLGEVGVHDFDYTVAQVTLVESSELVGLTVAEARLRQEHGCSLLALQRPGEPMPAPDPAPGDRLEAGATLVVMGGVAHVDRLQRRHGGRGVMTKVVSRGHRATPRRPR